MLPPDWGEAITGSRSIGLRCPPTNCNTNTGVVGRFGIISSDYSSI